MVTQIKLFGNFNKILFLFFFFFLFEVLFIYFETSFSIFFGELENINNYGGSVTSRN